MKYGFAVLLALSSPAFADDPPPVRTLLADPAQLATWLRDHDALTIAAREKIEQASQQAEQARVYPNPQASAGLGGIAVGSGNNTSVDPTTGMVIRGPTGFFDTSNIAIGVSELFEIGKRGPRREAADLRTREAIESAVGSLGGRINDAATTLGKLAYITARQGVAAQNLDAARKLQTNEQIRLEHKDLAGIDFDRIELDTEALEIELGRADAELAVALANCSATLFAPCISTGLDAVALDAAAPLPEALPLPDPSITERPSHVAQRLEESALGEDARLAEHRKIPDPTLGVTYTYDNYVYGGNVPQTLAFSLGIPLPLFDRGNHDAAAARANARSIAASEIATIRTAHGQVDALAAQLAALKATLDRLDKNSVPKAQKIVEATRKAFDLGQLGLADLLLAQRQYRDLLLQSLDTRFDLFNVRVQLRQQLGLDDQIARAAGARR